MFWRADVLTSWPPRRRPALPDHIRVATACNDTARVRSWLRRGRGTLGTTARHGFDGETMLVIASSRGHAEMVALLLSAGACVGEHGNGLSALAAAAAAGHTDIVVKLFNAGARVGGSARALEGARRDGPRGALEHKAFTKCRCDHECCPKCEPCAAERPVRAPTPSWPSDARTTIRGFHCSTCAKLVDS